MLVRVPDGTRISRRFLRWHSLQKLFDHIDISALAAENAPGTYKLVTQFPRQTFTDGQATKTFQEAGLTSKQEALMLEPI